MTHTYRPEVGGWVARALKAEDTIQRIRDLVDGAKARNLTYIHLYDIEQALDARQCRTADTSSNREKDTP